MLERFLIKSINSSSLDLKAIGLFWLFLILLINVLLFHFSQKDKLLFNTSSRIFPLLNAPPPNENTPFSFFRNFKEIFSSIFLKNISLFESKILEIFMSISFSISASISKKFNFSFFATSKPTEVFPEPIMPIKTRFFFDFISFFIEKTQICLNLKLINDICNLLKTQVQAKAI